MIIPCFLFSATLPREVAYGAIVTLKNYKTGGGYLHSHPHLYPKNVGARQQQITTYTHKDDNNKWLIKPYNKETIPELQILKNGDLIRLEHIATRRNLHTHREMAPITPKHYQVSVLLYPVTSSFLILYLFLRSQDMARMVPGMRMIYGN